MKKPVFFPEYGYYVILWSISIFTFMASQKAEAQSCPSATNTFLSSYPNTYYPAATQSLNVGATTIGLGAPKFGSDPIQPGDILLVIQMQGAQINSTNGAAYGDGTGTGSGYLNNAQFLAGTMEFVVAKNSVPVTGGTLILKGALSHAYQTVAPGANGQYTFQVIRVPFYYTATLAATVTAPAWNGSSGGVIVLAASNVINLNGQTLDASGAGFRGGGGRSLQGASSGASTDYVTLSSAGANGSKGEGIAGTPIYVNGIDRHGNQALITNASEGYPSGSYAKGAPGNAGGGATDGDPAGTNDQNTGGGGGGNGGLGGNGGNAWSSGTASGGLSGAIFAQASTTRLVMGGGGGAGTTNNGTGTPGNGLASSGSAGGGIIILYSQNQITGIGTVNVSGANGNTTVQNDGAGGGGAGGSILIWAASYSTTNITALATGGNGGSNETTGGPLHGPGGGGGGGVIYSNSALNAASSVAGGVAGTTGGGTTNYGATGGSAGTTINSLAPSKAPAFPIMCTILAANFVDVTARTGNNAIDIGWTVANEATTLGYVIERSTNGTDFSAIDSVPYRQGNDVINTYQYIDASGYAIGGTLYYRIRETEAGGKFTDSKIVTVHVGVSSASGDLSVFPNPVSGSVNVSFNMTNSAYISLRLFDLKGAQLWQQQFQASAGQNSLQIDRTAGLPDGIYILQWFDGLNPRTAKVLVRH